MVRKKIYRFIVKNIFHIPDGTVLPKYLVFFQWVLFPFKKFLYSNTIFRYNVDNDTFLVNGKEIYVEVLRKIANVPDRTVLQIQTDSFGAKTLRHIVQQEKD
jgi:hypothetical protein